MRSPKPRVLYSEDDADTRGLVTFLLKKEGFDVVTTRGQYEVLAWAKKKQVDLYLLDYWMAEHTGLYLCKKLREFDSETPVLIYSGAAFASEKKRAMECGAQGYLVKPVDNDFLVAEVSRLVSESRKAKQVDNPKNPLGSAKRTYPS